MKLLSIGAAITNGYAAIAHFKAYSIIWGNVLHPVHRHYFDLNVDKGNGLQGLVYITQSHTLTLYTVFLRAYCIALKTDFRVTFLKRLIILWSTIFYSITVNYHEQHNFYFSRHVD